MGTTQNQKFPNNELVPANAVPAAEHQSETDYEKADVSGKSNYAATIDKERALKRRKCIIGSLTCLFIIAVISLSVGLSVGLAVRNSKWYVSFPDVIRLSDVAQIFV